MGSASHSPLSTVQDSPSCNASPNTLDGEAFAASPGLAAGWDSVSAAASDTDTVWYPEVIDEFDLSFCDGESMELSGMVSASGLCSGAGSEDCMHEFELPCEGDSADSSYSSSSPMVDDGLWECPHCHEFVVPARRCSYCLSINSDFEEDPFEL